MTILEKKVDALIRLCLSEDPLKRGKLKKELQDLLEGRAAAGSIREEAIALQIELGVPLNLSGFCYATEAICIAANDPEAVMPGNVTALYDKVADLFGGTKGSCVARCIRAAIERCFENCDPDVIRQYFGNTVSPQKGKLTNSEFINACGRIVRGRVFGEGN